MPADAGGKRRAEDAQPRPDEGAERASLAEAMAVVRVREARGNAGLEPPCLPKHLRMKRGDERPLEQVVRGDGTHDPLLVARRLHVEVEPDPRLRRPREELERVLERRAVGLNLRGRMSEAEPAVHGEDVELDDVHPGRERGLDRCEASSRARARRRRDGRPSGSRPPASAGSRAGRGREQILLELAAVGRVPEDHPVRQPLDGGAVVGERLARCGPWG